MDVLVNTQDARGHPFNAGPLPWLGGIARHGGVRRARPVLQSRNDDGRDHRMHPQDFMTGGALQGLVAASLVHEHDRRSDLKTGQLIGAYRIVREVARGGMAIVYLAERADQAYTQKVALKWIRGIRGPMRRPKRCFAANARHWPTCAIPTSPACSMAGIPQRAGLGW